MFTGPREAGLGSVDLRQPSAAVPMKTKVAELTGRRKSRALQRLVSILTFIFVCLLSQRDPLFIPVVQN